MASRAAKGLAKTRATRREVIHQAYCERHPEQAAEQRRLRKAQAQLQKDFGYRRAATPETMQKALAAVEREGTLARMFRAGTISLDQLAWAEEICRVYERLSREATVGTMSLETRVDQSRGGDGTFFERLGAVRAEIAYTAWRQALPRAGAVLAMIVEDLGCRETERRFRLKSGAARPILLRALDAWPDFQRDACDQLDEATLLAAQAAIL